VSASLSVTTVPALEAVAGLVHGFERRPVSAASESRDEGRRRVAEALADRGRLLMLRQVHGTRVLEAPWEGAPEGDAGLAAEAGLFVGVETADCLPILLVSPSRRLAAAVHAGWRGTAAGVARHGIEALVAAGSDPGDVVAALGPAIGACCYEVGDEVREAFGPHGAAFFRPGPNGRPHLDLRAANVKHLLEAGVSPGSIHHVADCTFCRADVYHSFRREGKDAGRMISFVGFAR
jgi:hypothetical protein